MLWLFHVSIHNWEQLQDNGSAFYIWQALEQINNMYHLKVKFEVKNENKNLHKANRKGCAQLITEGGGGGGGGCVCVCSRWAA